MINKVDTLLINALELQRLGHVKVNSKTIGKEKYIDVNVLKLSTFKELSKNMPVRFLKDDVKHYEKHEVYFLLNKKADDVYLKVYCKLDFKDFKIFENQIIKENLNAIKN